MRHELAGVALAGLAALIAASALFEPGYYDSHDGLLNVHRLFQLERCVEDGQLPCRWAPDMGRGYGYPVFNYYPPLGTHIALALRGAGLGIQQAVKGSMALALLMAAAGAFALARRFLPGRSAAVTAVVFVLSPYVAVDVYVRGAQAEAWGLALLPWAFWGGERAVRGSAAGAVACALAWAALLLAHPLTAVMAALPYAAWLAAASMRERAAGRPPGRIALGLGWGHGLALALAAFFVGPSLLELDAVHAGTLTSLYPWAQWQNNFLAPSELAAVWPQWGYGAFRSEGGMTLFLGPLQLACLLGAAVVLALRARSLSDVDGAAAVLCGSGLLAAMMTLSLSRPLWEVASPLAWLQFPWRFLGLASLAAAFCAGWLVDGLRARPLAAGFATALLCIGPVASSWTWFQPSAMHVVPDSSLANRREVAKAVHGLFDFLPRSVDLDAFRAAPPPLAPPPATGTGLTIESAERRSDHIEVTARADGPDGGSLRFESFSFPGWGVRLDDRGVEAERANDPLGRLHVRVPPGTHRVVARLDETPTRRAANAVSAFALVALGVSAALAWRDRRAAAAE